MAEIFHRRGFPIYLDPGYDLHVYAGNFGRSFGEEARHLPEWIQLVRVLGHPLPDSYTPEIVERLRKEVARGAWDQPPGRSKAWSNLHDTLRKRIVGTLQKLRARFLIVENGTLPENPLVTEALYDAIEHYGTKARLGRYVLWRDFDLMWSVEKHRYGPFPYRGVSSLRPSQYIQYAVATDWMRRRMSKWVPRVPIAVLPNRFSSSHPDLCTRKRFREALSIPDNAILIARCTRVIPQKCIERDLRLTKILLERLRHGGSDREVFLFITGPVDEDPGATAKLQALAAQLKLNGNIVWGDGLLPYNPLVRRGFESNGFSVADLLHASDVSSFLTSYGFEGFGNPPGEAMAIGAPYITTSYELYNEVYRDRGAVAPVLEISRSTTCSTPIKTSFVAEVLRLIFDTSYQRSVLDNNSRVWQKHFSIEHLEGEIQRILRLDKPLNRP